MKGPTKPPIPTALHLLLCTLLATVGAVGFGFVYGLTVLWVECREDKPMCAFHTGFGDGAYVWHEITAEGKLCGYLCDFLPQDEEAEDEETEDEEADPGRSADAPAPAGRQTVASPPAWPAELVPRLEPGVNVAVRCGIFKNWFLAQLIEKNDAACRVQSPSGTVMDVDIAELVPMPNRAVFRAGDLVAAHWVDAPLRPAVVRTTSPTHCEVEWHAAEALHTVAIGELTFQEWLVRISSGIPPAAAALPERATAEPPEPSEAAPALGPGVAVGVRGGKGKFVLGRIAKAVTGGFAIDYPTGDREKMKEKHLIAVPDRPVFRTGDAVRAVWSGMRLSPGRITALVPAGYVVAWDDGFAPQIVPLGLLTFRSWAPE